MLYIWKTGRRLRTRFGEHRHAVISNGANQPILLPIIFIVAITARVSDMIILAHSDGNHRMRLISKLGTIRPYGISKRFSYVWLYLSLPYVL
jgi:hypothetical protein